MKWVSGGAQEIANFFRKLRSRKFFDRSSSFESNIILHKFCLGPKLWNRDPVYEKILVTPLVQRLRIKGRTKSFDQFVFSFALSMPMSYLNENIIGIRTWCSQMKKREEKRKKLAYYRSNEKSFFPWERNLIGPWNFSFHEYSLKNSTEWFLFQTAHCRIDSICFSSIW
jgi:hypothetical protein